MKKVYVVVEHSTDPTDEYAIVYTSFEAVFETKDGAEKHLAKIGDGRIIETELRR